MSCHLVLEESKAGLVQINATLPSQPIFPPASFFAGCSQQSLGSKALHSPKAPPARVILTLTPGSCGGKLTPSLG